MFPLPASQASRELANFLVVYMLPNFFVAIVFFIMGLSGSSLWYIPSVFFALVHCAGWVAMLFADWPDRVF